MASTEYYDSLIARIEGVKDCDDLLELNVAIPEIFDLQLESILASLEALLPIISIPDPDIPSIIEWITASVALPLVSYNNLLLEQALALVKQAEALAALQLKLTAPEFNCTIPEIPSP